ncbi:MAG: ABC transporter permease [Bacillota bacterium]
MRLEIGKVVETVIDWLTANLSGLFNFIKTVLSGVIDGFEWLFTIMPFWVFIILFTLLALKLSNYKVAIFAAIGMFLIYLMALWAPAMATLALVGTATLVALVIGLPLGILMAKYNGVDKVVRPILDFMQTMPAFVYLIPAVYFFGLGPVPGAIATIIFAMPPIVRLTNLGIRQVPEEVIEASKSFGSTSAQMLFKVQVPLATPTILAGLNQTIMLSLSMVVISAMISSGGLGENVLFGINRMQIGIGFEAGLAVVILAMILDRVTQSIGNRQEVFSFTRFFKKLYNQFSKKSVKTFEENKKSN